MAIFKGLVSAVTLFLAGCSGAHGPASIEYPTTLPLGERALGDIVTGEIVVGNRGSSPLTITNVRTNCSCSGLEYDENGTATKVVQLVIPGGDKVQLRLRQVVHGNPGEEQKTAVFFESNDPNNLHCRIDVAVSKVIGIGCNPKAAIFGNATSGAKLRQVVELRDICGSPLTVTAVVCADPSRVSARVLPRQQIENSIEASSAQIEIVPNSQVFGRLESRIDVHVKTSDATKIIAIPVTAQIMRPVEVSPQTVFLPLASSTGPVNHATVVCRSTSLQPLKLRLVESPDGISVNIQVAEEESPVRLVRIECQPPGDSQPAQVHTLRFAAETAGREYPVEIRIEYRGRGSP